MSFDIVLENKIFSTHTPTHPPTHQVSYVPIYSFSREKKYFICVMQFFFFFLFFFRSGAGGWKATEGIDVGITKLGLMDCELELVGETLVVEGYQLHKLSGWHWLPEITGIYRGKPCS